MSGPISRHRDLLHRAGVLLASILACGPTIDLETDGSSATGTATTNSNEASADETGASGAACGLSDTELVGGGPPGPLGYPDGCDPSNDPGINGYRCCSDDPAAAGGLAPDYQDKNISNAGLPYFSGNNNGFSRTGQCIHVAAIAGQGLLEAAAANCPIPCNPTWPGETIADVCGPARVCCQTRAIEPKDCIEDPETGLFRPVTGGDIIATLTNWRPGDHATHQDPNGSGCQALAGGDLQSPFFLDCVEQLNVANQRGFCMGLPAGQACPHEQPGYIDACEMLNGG
ncbi:MAG: hypothetical protein AAGF11_21535 [Myxococcota bacterium]